MYYADSDFCDSNNIDNHNHKGYPIRPIGSDGLMEPWYHPFFLIVDRGSCSFVTKVRPVLWRERARWKFVFSISSNMQPRFRMTKE